MKQINPNFKRTTGFTIIELIIVVSIIGILAIITTVSYIGLTKQAVATSLKSDLTNASETLRIFKANHGSYPATINCNDDENSTNTCIKMSDGNTYISYVRTDSGFTLVEKNTDTGLRYYITENSKALALSFSVKSISVGAYHTCVIAYDDQAYCWGRNNYGQLGNGTTTDSSTPVAVDASGFLSGKGISKIYAGDMFTCALTYDDQAYCWGRNNYGQLGNGTTTDSSIPVAVDTSGLLNGKTIQSLSVGGYGGTVCVVASDYRAYCWGWNGNMAFGNGSSANSSVPVAVSATSVLNGKSLSYISTSGVNTVALDINGNAYWWGVITGISSVSSPSLITPSGALAGKTIRSIYAGYGFICTIASDYKPYCWGTNDGGQLGDGTTTSSSTPVAVVTSGVLSGKTLQSLSVGSYPGMVCTIASDDKAYCWGYNAYGVLGNGTNVQSSVPVPVDVSATLNGKDIKSVSILGRHACAIDDSGQAYCWGYNSYSELGNGSTAASYSPVKVTITAW